MLEAGPLRIDLARREVTVDGREVRLTPTEFKLLALLARHAGKVLTHRQILQEVWGPNATEAHYVRVHMAELRKKIEADPGPPAAARHRAGVGYRLRERIQGGCRGPGSGLVSRGDGAENRVHAGRGRAARQERQTRPAGLAAALTVRSSLWARSGGRTTRITSGAGAERRPSGPRPGGRGLRGPGRGPGWRGPG